MLYSMVVSDFRYVQKKVSGSSLSLNLLNDHFKSVPGVGISGTLVPMSTRLPAGTLQNFKILGTAGCWVPTKFQKFGSAQLPDRTC